MSREFPSPTTFDHWDVNDQSQKAIDAWVEVRWFHGGAVAAGYVCKRYADGESRLSFEVSLRTLETFSWTQHFCFKDGDLSLSVDKTLTGARRAFVASALSGLGRWRSLVEALKDVGMDVFHYREEKQRNWYDSASRGSYR